MTKNILLTFLILFLFGQSTFAQIDKNSALYKTILTKDSLLFEVGFNHCNIKQFEDLLSEDLRFYHDKSGSSDKSEFLGNMQNGLCADSKKYQARRELVPETTKIYALYDNDILYGAIQEGVHQFYEKTAGQSEKFGSSAKFTHLWILENDEWKLANVLSFEHSPNQISIVKTPVFDNDSEIEKWLNENNVPILGIGLIRNGTLKQVDVFGEFNKGISAPYNTIFNVASLTKPVTAIIALKLLSLGKWDLDEPLCNYWIDPDIENDDRYKKLTTRLILSHQTGFPNWRGNNKDGKLNFIFDPGLQYQYSGEGYEYLRKALEKKFDKSLQQLGEELIFEPLEMTDTRFIWDDNVDSTRVALGYDTTGIPYEIINNKTPNGADELLTTIEDYGKFLVSILNGDGLSTEVFKEMTSHQVATTKGKYFGLGFEIYDLENGKYALSHGGSDKGVQVIFFIFPETKEGLLIFTNVDGGHKVFEPLVKYYLGENGQKIVDIEMKE